MKNSEFLVRAALIALSAIVCIAANAQTTWYVTGQGNDANDGRSEKTAFRSLQKAADLVGPGDVVLVGDGLYTKDDRSSGSAVVLIRRSGAPDAWITWKALPGQHPVVRPTGWGGITIQASYHIIDGIDVIGRNDELTLKDAIKDLSNKSPDPTFNSNGIFVEGRPCPPDAKPHHVIVRNCTVAKCPGGGITGIETDYLTVEDCKVYNNAWYMRYAGSGITLLNNWAFDNKPGYHVIIRRNLVWNNKCFVSWERIGKLSDGNGILLDVTNQDGLNLANPEDLLPGEEETPVVPGKGGRPIWTNKALIANNVSAYNGGSGIHTFRTCNVDIVNNTTYWNGTNVGYEEIFSNASIKVTIMNNIMVPRPGGAVTSNHRNQGLKWDYNLYPVEQNVVVGPHDIVADPQFVNPGIDLSTADFSLLKSSPAVGAATDELVMDEDITGRKRPKGKAADLGAYER